MRQGVRALLARAPDAAADTAAELRAQARLGARVAFATTRVCAHAALALCCTLLQTCASDGARGAPSGAVSSLESLGVTAFCTVAVIVAVELCARAPRPSKGFVATLIVCALGTMLSASLSYAPAAAILARQPNFWLRVTLAATVALLSALTRHALQMPDYALVLEAGLAAAAASGGGYSSSDGAAGGGAGGAEGARTMGPVRCASRGRMAAAPGRSHAADAAAAPRRRAQTAAGAAARGGADVELGGMRGAGGGDESGGEWSDIDEADGSSSERQLEHSGAEGAEASDSNVSEDRSLGRNFVRRLFARRDSVPGDGAPARAADASSGRGVRSAGEQLRQPLRAGEEDDSESLAFAAAADGAHAGRGARCASPDAAKHTHVQCAAPSPSQLLSVPRARGQRAGDELLLSPLAEVRWPRFEHGAELPPPIGPMPARSLQIGLPAGSGDGFQPGWGARHASQHRSASAVDLTAVDAGSSVRPHLGGSLLRAATMFDSLPRTRSVGDLDELGSPGGGGRDAGDDSDIMARFPAFV
ncbi:hypothetical protein T492DRAFT_1149267 [Pavlovales sp. CCMP2436]|nr:hypothetical protein T492DRAFT_1149267 [Pavlovales sp. CCMP2436]